MVDKLISICNILGVSYDSDYLSSLSADCDKVNYLLNQILIFLGGGSNA